MAKYLLTIALCLISISVWGQNSTSADAILVNLSPPITQKMADSYTNFQEWHFELRFTPEQRQKYQAFLVEDLKKGRLVDDVRQSVGIVDNAKKSDWMTLFNFHSQQKSKDEIEESTEQMLNNGQIHGDGIKAQTRKEAKNGYLSSAFLLKTVADYKKPLIGDGNIHTSLFRRQIDATFEWTAFRITMVAGKKVIEANDESRNLMEQRLIKTWNDNKNNPNKLANFRSWLELNVNNWLVWRIGDYSYFARLTPYQKKSQLAEWGQEVLGFAPEMKPYVDARIKEYKDYVAKMSNEEIKSEFELKKKSDAKFAAKIQQMQNDMRNTQQTFAQMRQSMLDFHVANLNISENIGNTGYVWQIKNY